MNTRIVAIAAALTVAAASSALAQDTRTLDVRSARVDAPAAQSRSFFGLPASVLADQETDAVTTGSIDRPRAARNTGGSAYRYSGPHAGGPAKGPTRD